MNTKLIHYDQCYYNEHKINSSQRNTQSTTHLLYLLTKNNRTIILHQVTHVAMGTASMPAIQKCFLLWESTKIFLQGGSLSIIVNKDKAVKTWITNGSPDLYQSEVRDEANEAPGAMLKEALSLRVLQVWAPPLVWPWQWALDPYTGCKPRI